MSRQNYKKMINKFTPIIAQCTKALSQCIKDVLLYMKE